MRLNRNNDDYFTPLSVWDMISDLLPRDVVIWEAFYNKASQSASHLRSLGCQVVWEDVDFFTHDLGDVIVTNPPFSNKTAVMQRLVLLDKPFILLLPIHSLCTKYMRDSFMNKLQVIVPNGRIHYERSDESGANRLLKRTSFDSIFVCYKMNLPRDVLWL